MLAGAGLGDDPLLAHPLGEQRLADGVVDLVRAGVGEVLALEVDAPPDPLGEALGEVERRRAADEVAQQPLELGARRPRRRARLAQAAVSSSSAAIRTSGTKRPAVGAEALLDPGRRRPSRGAAIRRSSGRDRCARRPGPACGEGRHQLVVLDPRRRLDPAGDVDGERRAMAIASATLSGVRPPARISGHLGAAARAISSQSKLSPVPPGVPGRWASKR